MGQNSSADWAIIASVVTDSTHLLPLQLYTKPSFHSYGRDFHSASNSQTCVNTQEIFGNLLSLSGLQLLKTTRIYRPYGQPIKHSSSPTYTHTHTHTHTHKHLHTHTGHLPGMSHDYNVCVLIIIELMTINIGLFINNLHFFNISNCHRCSMNYRSSMNG